MANHNNEEWIAEEDLAHELGIKRDDLRAERPAANSGQVKAKGNVIFWLKKAAAGIASKLGLSLPEKKAAAPVVEVLTVFSQPGPSGYHFGNAHLIKAQRANKEIVVVRVVDSRKYVRVGKNGKPMQLRAQPATEGTWWILVGREPRFRGAW